MESIKARRLPIEYHNISARRIVLSEYIAKNELTMQEVKENIDIIKRANKATSNDGETLRFKVQSIRNRRRVQKNY